MSLNTKVNTFQILNRNACSHPALQIQIPFYVKYIIFSKLFSGHEHSIMSLHIFFSHKFNILISSSEVKHLFTDIHHTLKDKQAFWKMKQMEQKEKDLRKKSGLNHYKSIIKINTKYQINHNNTKVWQNYPGKTKQPFFFLEINFKLFNCHHLSVNFIHKQQLVRSTQLNQDLSYRKQEFSEHF